VLRCGKRRDSRRVKIIGVQSSDMLSSNMTYGWCNSGQHDSEFQKAALRIAIEHSDAILRARWCRCHPAVTSQGCSLEGRMQRQWD
jgi:hypothetical protein